ncbi:PilZ domain-containing protein [Desulfopila sp. IMCC35008]|uniref:PilZ domain-containing protein n=1 Tax=Desulfopila sp. IMCC35008 TaxID=2653858 RepID=UPI0013D78309|nr:PilZ domain-containing protein [Desulfopila sp. IMCC35008]
MTEEKRRFSRVVFGMNAKLILADQEITVGEIINLSVGGCQLDITAALEAGSKCRMLIELNPADRRMNVEVDGEIVRVEESSASIRFLSINPEDLVHLQNIIRYNSPDPDKVEKEIDEHPGLV